MPPRLSASWRPRLVARGAPSWLVHFAIPFVVMVSVFLFASIGHEVREDGRLGIDLWAQRYIHVPQHSSMYAIMTSVSWFAGPHVVPWLVLVGVAFTVAIGRFRPDGISLLVAVLGGLAMIVALKAGYHRERPDIVFASLGYSYPSGHSFFAAILYGLVGYHIQRHLAGAARWLTICIAAAVVLLVGYSRVALGEHFLTDVAGGYALALPWLWICVHLPEYFPWMGRARQ